MPLRRFFMGLFFCSMGQLNKHREGLQRERDRLLGELALLKEKIDEMKQDQENLHVKIAAATESAEEAHKQMEVSKSFLLFLHFD